MIMNKKAKTTMTGLVIGILITMGLFFGTYDYITTNYESANVDVPLNSTRSHDDLETTQADLDTNIENIKGAAQNISEADANVVLVAWNGLTGLAYTMRLFLGVIDIGITSFNVIFPVLSFLPDWSKPLLEMAIVIFIILIIIGAFKGESKT